MQLALRDRLAYPAGVAPGFDPSHIAAQAPVVFSAMAANDVAAIALSPIKPLPNSGASTFPTNPGKIDAALGYSANCADGRIIFGPTGFPSYNLQNATFAAFVRFASVGSAAQNFVHGSSADIAGLVLTITAARWGFSIRDSGGGGISPTTSVIPAGVAGVPYFVVASIKCGVGGIANFVVVRLDTGQMWTETVTGFSTNNAATSPQVGFGFGCRPASAQPAKGFVSHAMFNTTYMSMASLRAWAQDPWSFWYPRVEPETFKGGSLANLFTQTVSVTVSSALSLARGAGKIAAIGCASTVTAAKASAKSIAVTCASATTALKQTAKAIAATCGSAVTATRLRTILVTIAAGCASAVSNSRAAAKMIAATCASAVTAPRQTAKTIAATCTSAVTVGRIRVFLVTLAIGCASVVTRRVAVSKSVAVACSGAVGATRQSAKSIAVACAGAFAIQKQAAKRIAVSCVSSVTVGRIRVFLVTVAVGFASAAGLTKASGKVVSVTAAGAVAITKSIATRIAVSVASLLELVAVGSGVVTHAIHRAVARVVVRAGRAVMKVRGGRATLTQLDD